MILIPVLTSVLCFLALLACFRFVLSRQGWFWVLPLIISLFFLYISIEPLVKVASGAFSGSYMVQISPDRSVREIIPLIVVFLWLIMLFTFHRALRIVVPENSFLHKTRKSMSESKYIEQVALKRQRRASALRNKRSRLGYLVNEGKLYPKSWIALFDDF